MSPEAKGPPAPALSLVIPAYNEEVRLSGSLDAVARFASSYPAGCEVILVDDGSSDRTAEIARGFAAKHRLSRVLVNERNRGKGYSIRRGVLDATGDTILISDADLSTPLTEAAKLLERLKAMGEGIAIGSRGLAGSNVEIRQNALRELMGRTFNLVVRSMTGLPFRDTQCGFKAMSRRIAEPIFRRARVDRFSWDVEILYVARKRGVKIEEIPVTWRNAPGSKVGILSAPIEMLRDVIRIRRWYRQGVYDPPEGSGSSGSLG
ncbi:MAG: glycosyltransferase family 2 protein [Acidobacteria bacterium]|nr:glycosyltransferase family 2 protein [Acidobacteriota bacterium]